MAKTQQSLGTKLKFVFGVLGLGPLILMGVIALWIVTVTHRNSVATMETQLLSQKVAEIDKFIKETIGLFEVRVGYAETSIISDRDQKFLLAKLLEENAFIVEASFSDLTGKETSKYSRIQDATYAQLSNIALLPKFQTAKNSQSYFGPVYYTLQGPMMTFAAPVLNRNNQIIMVLAGEISLSVLNDILSSARLGKNGYVFLIDQYGTIVASADTSLLYKNVSESTWIQTLLAGKPHTGLEKDDKRTGLLGIEVLAAGLPLQNWGIIAEWPTRDAFSVITTIQRQVIAFSLLTVVGVGLLGWLVGRKILEPLSVLKKGAQRIGTGDFDYKIEITTRDEIEELGEVFNRMGEDLKRLEELKAAQIKAEALAASLKKEKELSKMKDEFMTNTSHQLRTPLSIINWSLELLLEAGSVEDQKPFISDLKEGLEQLNVIVRDLLTVSEFGPGFKNSSTKQVNLLEVFNKVAKDREQSFAKKQIQWEAHIPEGAAVLVGDSLALQNVLEHLLDNTLIYTPEKGRVTATLTAENQNLHLKVQDTGIGIPEKDKASIFTQFFRATNAVSMRNVGTGLGLYICKNIVEGHGGKIWFESEEHKGTTIHITLPTTPPQPLQDPSKEPTPAIQEPPPSSQPT